MVDVFLSQWVSPEQSPENAVKQPVNFITVRCRRLEWARERTGRARETREGGKSSLTPPRVSPSSSPLFLAYYLQMFCDDFSDASCLGFHQKSGRQSYAWWLSKKDFQYNSKIVTY